jgi:glycine hydroxymethyltransferase
MGKDYENKMGIKTLKGDRLKLMSEIYDGTVMPGIQGGPLMHIIMAKAVAFGEALQDSFKDYIQQVILNAKTLSDKLMEYDFQIISGGTDNHLMLVDLSNKDISGKKTEKILEEAGITLNKNMVPFDTRSPFVTSGIRIGTAATTTRGMKEAEMEKIAEFINRVISNPENENVISQVKTEIRELTKQFPLYPELA